MVQNGTLFFSPFGRRVAVFDLFLHVQLAGEHVLQDLPLLKGQVFIAARVELAKEHVHHGQVLANAQLFEEGSANLEEEEHRQKMSTRTSF